MHLGQGMYPEPTACLAVLKAILFFSSILRALLHVGLWYWSENFDETYLEEELALG